MGVLALMAALGAACDSSTGPNQPEPPDLSFEIDVRYWGTPPTPSQQTIIARAVARWETLLNAGLPSARVRGDAGCGPGSPAIDEQVDDLVVFVRIVDIPALAESGPCKIRDGSLLPITGTIWLDGPTRIAGLSTAALESLVTHELAHVLGFGTLWEELVLLSEPAALGGLDPHFTGARAIEAFDVIGGDSYGGPKVPVEKFGGDGTADSHWRSDVFGDSELMSYTIVAGANPLSRVTAAAIADLGYDVDIAQADTYWLPGASSSRSMAPSTEAIRLTESEPRWSLKVTDGAGRVVRSTARQ